MLACLFRNKRALIVKPVHINIIRRHFFRAAATRLTAPLGAIARHPLTAAATGGGVGGLAYGWASKETPAATTLEQAALGADSEGLSRAADYGASVVHIHGPVHIYQAPHQLSKSSTDLPTALPSNNAVPVINTTAPSPEAETVMRSMVEDFGECLDQDVLTTICTLNLIILLVLVYLIKKLTDEPLTKAKFQHMVAKNLLNNKFVNFFLASLSAALVLYVSIHVGIAVGEALQGLCISVKLAEISLFITTAWPYIVGGVFITMLASYLKDEPK